MVSDFYKGKMLERAVKRKEAFMAQYDRLVRCINDGKIDGESNRLWMEEQIKGLKNGLDICCGDLLIGENSEGVDGDRKYIGATWHIEGDALTHTYDEWADYVVTNYIDCFPNVLKVLNEWKRVLKPGGVLAFTCADADKWSSKAGGPLRNKHRQSLLTKNTIAQYLIRAGYENVQTSSGPEEDKTMRVRCNKP